MKTICLYFQVHQPMRLRKYRFFDMGTSHNYLDDAANRSIMQKVARRCYLPMNALLLKLIEEHKGAFRVTFSISGPAIEQFRAYAPEVLESFRKLAATGHVEFLAETYSHSLASLIDMEEFRREVTRHAGAIETEFGQRPRAFRNTELIYSDVIGAEVAAMGFKTMLAEGARHVLGWKSPNYLYAGALDQKLRLLLRNYKLSDDIAFRFSNRGWDEWPLTAEKYVGWLADDSNPGEVVNLFMDYETFGEHQWADSGIFDFMARLPDVALAKGRGLEFATVSETAAKYQPVAILHSPHAMSWADEERDVTAWLGNELQDEAFSKLYALGGKVREVANPDFDFVWSFLQNSDHFYYMATKWLSDGDVHTYFNPYGSAYEAFINYMNVLSDFTLELDRALEARGSTTGAAVAAATSETAAVPAAAAASASAAAATSAKKTKKATMADRYFAIIANKGYMAIEADSWESLMEKTESFSDIEMYGAFYFGEPYKTQYDKDYFWPKIQILDANNKPFTYQRGEFKVKHIYQDEGSYYHKGREIKIENCRTGEIKSIRTPYEKEGKQYVSVQDFYFELTNILDKLNQEAAVESIK